MNRKTDPCSAGTYIIPEGERQNEYTPSPKYMLGGDKWCEGKSRSEGEGEREK